MSTCEARVTVKLFKRLFPNLKKTFPCTSDAAWVGTHSCCGATSECCDAHHKLAVSLPTGAQIKCSECGTTHTTMMWRKL